MEIFFHVGIKTINSAPKIIVQQPQETFVKEKRNSYERVLERTESPAPQLSFFSIEQIEAAISKEQSENEKLSFLMENRRASSFQTYPYIIEMNRLEAAEKIMSLSADNLRQDKYVFKSPTAEEQKSVYLEELKCMWNKESS